MSARYIAARGLGSHYVELDGKTVMSVNTFEAADKMAALLNNAVEMSQDVFGLTNDGKIETGRFRVAGVVAMAMGHNLDWTKA